MLKKRIIFNLFLEPGGDAPPVGVGRGGMRGRRILPVDIITRPREIVSKTGNFLCVTKRFHKKFDQNVKLF